MALGADMAKLLRPIMMFTIEKIDRTRCLSK